MLQILPAILLLLLQSAPADRAALVLDWMARQNVVLERLPSAGPETETPSALAALVLKPAQHAHPVSQEQDSRPARVQAAPAQASEGFEESGRQRDGPASC
jgi:hypothetical protein